jgi:hypothetical protein
MKLRLLLIILLSYFVFSCQQNDTQHKLELEKETKKQDDIFKSINNAWVFMVNPNDSSVNYLTSNWAEWNTFISEISQKPKSSIGAFQKKTKTLSIKVANLNINIPQKFNIPQIKSRISVLNTKIKSLELFINLKPIPEKKVVALIPEINSELISLQMQMQEIIRKEQIPREAGEPDRIRMKDTTRLVPTNINQNQLKVE